MTDNLDPFVALRTLENERDEAKMRIITLERLLREMRAEGERQVARLKSRIAALEKEQAEAAWEAKLSERQALRAEVARAQARQADLERTLAEKEGALAAKAVETKKLAHELEAVRQTVPHVQAARDQAQRERDGALAGRLAAESALATRDVRIAALEKALADLTPKSPIGKAISRERAAEPREITK